MPPQLADNENAPDHREVLRALTVAKCAFQLRAISAVLGCEATPAPLRPVDVLSHGEGDRA